jgi:MFS family permease
MAGDINSYYPSRAFTPNLDRGMLLWMLALLFFLLQCSNNFANSPWSAIIADQVPWRQCGFTAGINRLALLLGTAFGAVVAGLIVNKHNALPLYKNKIAGIFSLPNHLGYTILFLVTIIYFLVGTVAIYQVKNVK